MESSPGRPTDNHHHRVRSDAVAHPVDFVKAMQERPYLPPESIRSAGAPLVYGLAPPVGMLAPASRNHFANNFDTEPMVPLPAAKHPESETIAKRLPRLNSE